MKKILYLSSAAVLALASCSDDLGFKQEVTQPIDGKYKITATYPIGVQEATRTTLEYNDGKFNYAWEDGDAIGVFNATEEDFTNGLFRYAGEGNTFLGDADVFTSNSFYGYYPYDPKAYVEKSSLTLYINQYQNYNYLADNLGTWTTGYPNGYFSQGAAPAVALGQCNADGSMSLSFNAIASYLVFPVTGDITANIKNFTLNVGGQDLYGSVVVDMDDLKNPFTDLDPKFYAASTGSSTTITLNAGNKFNLDKSNPVNLWFVVPAGITLQGQTITLTANYVDSKTGATVSSSVNRTMPAVMGEPVTSPNSVRWIGASAGTNDSFYFAAVDAYVIQTQQQFLEYAYLATAGTGFAADLYNKGAENVGNGEATYNSKYAAYCDFTNMVDENNELKPAFLANSIEFSQTELASFLGTNNVDYLSSYLYAIYGSYLTSGSILSIGGGALFTIYGNNQTISNLTVVGSGVFTPIADGWNVISDLTINDVTVDASAQPGTVFSFLQQNGVAYENVTVGSDCSVTVNPKAKNPETGLFGTLTTSFLNGTKNTVVNQTQYPYAVQLTIDSNFNFVKNGVNVTVNDFKVISLDETQGWGAQLTVAGKPEAIELMTIVQQPNPKAPVGYSVLDNYQGNTNVTSYWTGTRYGAGGASTINNATAEQLAEAAIQETSYTVTLGYNIDLMGDAETMATLTDAENFTQYWNCANNDPGKAYLTVNGKNGNNTYTISNAYIDGTVNTTGVLTMFGWGSVVNNLTINGVTINNVGTKATKNPRVAAISVGPMGTSKGNTVTNYYVNTATAYNNVVGGLYYSVGGDLSVMGNLNITWSPEQPTLTGIVGGNLAGWYEYDLSGTDSQTVTNPLGAGTSNLFGNYQIQVPQVQGGYLLTLVNFPTDFVNLSKFTSSTTEPLETNNMLTVKIGSSQNTYFWNENLNGAGKGGFQTTVVTAN